MSQTLRFKDQDVKKAKKDYKNLKLDEFQRDAINKIALLMNHYINLPLKAIKGSMWLTVKQWQEENKTTIQEIKELSREQQEQVMIRLMSIGKERIKKMMRNPEKQVEALDTAFQGVVEAVKIFMKKK